MSNRRYNFRVWDEYEKDFTYDLIREMAGHDYFSDSLECDSLAIALEQGTYDEYGLVVEQLVGQVGSNIGPIDLYENDIVATTPMVPGDEKYTNAVPVGVVKYHEYQWWVEYNNSAIPLFSETIVFSRVGNIHQDNIDMLAKAYQKPTM